MQIGLFPAMKDNTRQPIFNYKCGLRKANMYFISNNKLKKKKFSKTVKEKSDPFMRMKVL